MAVGPSVGIYLVDTLGYFSMFLVSLAFMVASALISLFVSSLPPAITEVRQGFNIRNTVDITTIPTSIMGLFNAMAYSSISAFLVLHAERQEVAGIGMFFMVYSAILLLVRPLMGRMSDKYSLKYVIFPTSLALIACLQLAAVATNIWMFFGAALLLGVGYGGAQPVIQAACIRDIAPERRGAASATYVMGQSLGMAIGPMISGTLAMNLDYVAMYRMMSINGLLCMLVMAWIDRRNPIEGGAE